MTAGLSVRAGLIAVAFMAMLALARSAPATGGAPIVLDSLTGHIGEWVATGASELPADQATILAADGYLHRFYEGPRGTIEMEVSYYARPRVGANMHSPLNCLPGNGWKIVDARTTTLMTRAGQWPARELIVERGQSRYALTYWYQSRSRVVADEFAARFYVLFDALRRRPTDAGLVRVMMPAEDDGTAARAQLAQFATVLIPELASKWRSKA